MATRHRDQSSSQQATTLLQRLEQELQREPRRPVEVASIVTALGKLGRTGAERFCHMVARGWVDQMRVLLEMWQRISLPQYTEALRDEASHPGPRGEGARRLLQAAGQPLEGPVQRAAAMLSRGTPSVECDGEVGLALVDLVHRLPRAQAEPWLGLLLDHGDEGVRTAAERWMTRWYGPVHKWVVRGPRAELTAAWTQDCTEDDFLSGCLVWRHRTSGFTVLRFELDDGYLVDCDVRQMNESDLAIHRFQFPFEWPPDYLMGRVWSASRADLQGEEARKLAALGPPLVAPSEHPALALLRGSIDTPLATATEEVLQHWTPWDFLDALEDLPADAALPSAEDLLREEVGPDDSRILSVRLLDRAWQVHKTEPELSRLAVQVAQDLAMSSLAPWEHPFWLGLAAAVLEGYDEEGEPQPERVDGDIDWARATAGDVPVEPLLTGPPGDESDLEDALDTLVYALESGYLLTWEAVIREEQGLTLSSQQQEALDELFSFEDDPDDERILYINGVPRPTGPWYEAVRSFAAALKVDRYVTSDSHFAVTVEGWPNLVDALEEHAGGLSLPAGVDNPVDVVSADLQHALWMQSAFSALAGLGQDPELTLEQQSWRLEEFAQELEEARESVEHVGWTLAHLLEVVILPPDDRRRLVEWLHARTGMVESDPLLNVMAVPA